jgi:hypothetical protein
MSDLRKAWRKRLAVTLRRFRRLRGRWPHPSVIVAAKIGIEQVVSRGIVPPVEH